MTSIAFKTEVCVFVSEQGLFFALTHWKLEQTDVEGNESDFIAEYQNN